MIIGETVHFTDEHLMHYEAIVSGIADEQHVNLYVNCYGHTRIVENVAFHPIGLKPMTWHKIDKELSTEERTVCEGNTGFVQPYAHPPMPPLPEGHRYRVIAPSQSDMIDLNQPVSVFQIPESAIGKLSNLARAETNRETFKRMIQQKKGN